MGTLTEGLEDKDFKFGISDGSGIIRGLNSKASSLTTGSSGRTRFRFQVKFSTGSGSEPESICGSGILVVMSFKRWSGINLSNCLRKSESRLVFSTILSPPFISSEPCESSYGKFW